MTGPGYLRHPYAYKSFKIAQSPPSCLRLYQTSRRHPRTYIITFWKSSPRYTHFRIFPPLHLISNYSFYSGTPYLNRHPYANATFGSRSSRHVPYRFSRISTSIYTFRQAMEPDLRRHFCSNIRSRSHSSSYPHYDFSRLSTSVLTFS